MLFPHTRGPFKGFEFLLDSCSAYCEKREDRIKHLSSLDLKFDFWHDIYSRKSEFRNNKTKKIVHDCEQSILDQYETSLKQIWNQSQTKLAHQS